MPELTVAVLVSAKMKLVPLHLIWIKILKLINFLMIVLYRWLAPLLLLLDLYEKVSVISKRKAEASKLLVSHYVRQLTDKFDC